MRITRTLFIVALAGCALLTAGHARWEGGLSLGNATWIIDLGRAPLWAPPPSPPHEQFARTFHDLPAAGTPGLRVTRAVWWEAVFAEFALLLFGVTAAFGLIYLNEPGRRRDVILQYGLCVAAGLGGAGLLCLAFWLVVGGWGPPLPVFFGLLGIMVGLCLGRWTYRRKAV